MNYFIQSEQDLVREHFASLEMGIIPFTFDESINSPQWVCFTDFFTVGEPNETGDISKILPPGLYEIHRVRNEGYSECYDFLVFRESGLRVNLQRLKSKLAWYETRIKLLLERRILGLMIHTLFYRLVIRALTEIYSRPLIVDRSQVAAVIFGQTSGAVSPYSSV